MTELVGLLTQLVRNMATSPTPLSADVNGRLVHKLSHIRMEPQSSGSSAKTNPLTMVVHSSTDAFLPEGKGIATSSDDLALKAFMPLMEQDLKAANEKYKKALKRLTPQQRMAQEKEFAELETTIKLLMKQIRVEHLDCIEKRGVTTGIHGQVLEQPELRILFFNDNCDLGLQRQVAAELMLVIESRHDYFKAKDIVEKNLDDYDL
ncbi:hypothetical protein Tco_0429812 [Tanacetum coccineum]